MVQSSIPKLNVVTPCSEKNDKLPWTCGYVMSYRGNLIGVRSNCPETLARLKSYFPESAVEVESEKAVVLYSFLFGKPTSRSGAKNYHILYDGWNRMARTLDLEEAVLRFRILLQQVILSLQGVTFLEGAVVGSESGAVLLVGEEEHRRSVYSVLLAQGGKRFGNTWIVIGQDGKVFPYAVQAADLSSDDIGGSPLQVNNVVFLVDHDEARKLTPGEAALRLYARADGAGCELSLKTVAKAVELADCKELRYDSDFSTYQWAS